jgi:hypothetical protein
MALERAFDLTRVYVERSWPSNYEDIHTVGEADFDAVIWFVRFRELEAAPTFDWQGYGGVKLMLEFDAYQNFSPLAGSRYLGAWPPAIKRWAFDWALCTGKAATDDLAAAGINTLWVPKAIDPLLSFDKEEGRHGLCYFGEIYEARRMMLKHLRQRKVSYEHVRCGFAELNDVLNKYTASLICNMSIQQRKGSAKRWLSRRGWLEVMPGPETMQKNFESAASGCVAFCDYIPEFDELEFRDGETVVTYRDFDELVDKLRYYKDHEDELRSIGRRGARLCNERHTWDIRVRQVENLLRALVT